ncbi:Asialoglycoprotein receptor 2 [Amphibalanus amphitrite]|uniref:Asialoglycoprotein receptor 2 n=1 Tax=Amphibalanus amphitrite TaxID=1232801 RepID=A0A6A4VLE5_AMPAM|nr:Asialoglycoprotein receptor 2 [Amphibalanus amphitrite]
MKPAAFRTLLVLALLALAVGQKNKSSRRKSKRKSTTTEAAPETTTTAAPTTTLPPPQQPARAPTQWYNGRGGPGSGPGFSGPGRPYYYLSWRDAPPTRMLYTWAEADDICRMEGGQLISVNTREKQSYLSWLFDEEAEDIRSLWTSGKFQTGEFRWADGTAVSAGYTRWSRTGPLFQPQPDNAEGFEDCIAVLNDLYGDGVAWHDEQCSYRHHFVCEL